MKEVQITKNFRLSEFYCKCGCTMPLHVVPHIVTLAHQLQVLRDHIQRPITITSGYRCVQRNIDEKGSLKSRHLIGMAADIKAVRMPPKVMMSIIEDLQNGFFMKLGGLHAYRTWTHYDTRGTRKRW
jgi:uncharacterized protein YcbK (DUF882 family)